MSEMMMISHTAADRILTKLDYLNGKISDYMENSVHEKDVYLTITEVMDRYKVSRPTIYKWRDNGLKLSGEAKGTVRINLRELKEFMGEK